MARMTATEKADRKAERIAMKARLERIAIERAPKLVALNVAISEGRAFLDTFRGRRRVVSYCDASGNAITSNGSGGMFDRETYMVCLETIQIVPAR